MKRDSRLNLTFEFVLTILSSWSNKTGRQKMQRGQLMGKHEVILVNDELGLTVVQTRFGLHVLGKNETVLASCVGSKFASLERGAAEHWAMRLEQDIIDGRTNIFTHVYYRSIKKGA